MVQSSSLHVGREGPGRQHTASGRSSTRRHPGREGGKSSPFPLGLSNLPFEGQGNRLPNTAAGESQHENTGEAHPPGDGGLCPLPSGASCRGKFPLSAMTGSYSQQGLAALSFPEPETQGQAFPLKSQQCSSFHGQQGTRLQKATHPCLLRGCQSPTRSGRGAVLRRRDLGNHLSVLPSVFKNQLLSGPGI